MCGICGKISRRKTETELRVLLQSMLDSMKWRGPDGRGIYIDNVGNDELLGLGQCRLSIFDLSENGKQPMYSSDGMSVIVYNDKNVVEYAINMPLSMKYKNRQLKYPLRQLLAQYIPYDIINRPKSGFGVPINKWMHEELKESIVSLMDDNFIKTEDIFDCDGIKALRKAFLERSSPIIDRVVYTLFMFQLWYMEYYK